MAEGKKKRRTPLMQTDVPSMTLNQALRIPRAIADQYAMKATAPLDVAAAVELQPNSGPFKMHCGAAIAYGLTEGGYNAKEIVVTPLGTRIFRPKVEGDEDAGLREAFLKPRVIGEFLRQYSGSPVPREEIAINVLEGMGVPRERGSDVFSMIVDGARERGLLRAIKEREYVNLGAATSSASVSDVEDPAEAAGEEEQNEGLSDEVRDRQPVLEERATDEATDRRRKRVFVTHGKNKGFLEPIKKLLLFGELEAVISVEKSTASKPVPEKVMADMRSCGAAIIHVDADRKVVDASANEYILINENVLIEIGAAMALYGRRFILLVAEGVKLPSNLQGLFRVDYGGDAPDGEATIRLLEAINDMKTQEFPS